MGEGNDIGRSSVKGAGRSPRFSLGGGKTLFALHLLLALYSLCSICGKLAAGFPFLSLGFVVSYGGMLGILAVYALGWQQVIKRMPLTSAYANRAVTIVWGIVWGYLVFGEAVSVRKLLGAAVVLAGVVLFALADKEGTDKEGTPGDGSTPSRVGEGDAL